ncbi:MAG: hypothetical protein MI976_18795 [Pseudomonadales bacterium]|nr:hypothetical protein [Pseudomonadales bacterium]
MFRILVLIMLLPVNTLAWEVNSHYKDEHGYTLLKRANSLADLGAAIDKEKKTLRSLSL